MFEGQFASMKEKGGKFFHADKVKSDFSGILQRVVLFVVFFLFVVVFLFVFNFI